MRIQKTIAATLLTGVLLTGCATPVVTETQPVFPALENTEATVSVVEPSCSEGKETEALLSEKPSTEGEQKEEPVQLETQTVIPNDSEFAETSKPNEPKIDEPNATQPPKSIEPTKAPEPPKQTEPPKVTEAPKQSEPLKPSEPPAQSEPPASSEAPTQPTEAPTEPPKPEIDVAALEAYGNQYAASLGFQIDYSMTTGNSGFFPPETWLLDSMDKGRQMVKDQVSMTRSYLIAYIGSAEGARCRVIVTDDGNGWYTCTALYG